MPLLSSGEMVGAIAMTEPDAGSDLQGIRTKAKRDGENGDFILNGSKVGFFIFINIYRSLVYSLIFIMVVVSRKMYF